MIKLTIIGAGSAVFTKNIVTDLLSVEKFKNMEIALQDIDPVRLKASHELLHVIFYNHKRRLKLRTEEKYVDLFSKDLVKILLNKKNKKLLNAIKELL